MVTSLTFSLPAASCEAVFTATSSRYSRVLWNTGKGGSEMRSTTGRALRVGHLWKPTC